MKIFGSLLLCILVFSVFCLNVQAQPQRPDQPYLEKVSVDPISGDFTLEWDMPIPQKSDYDVEEFVLYWFEPPPPDAPAGAKLGNARPFDTIADPNIRGKSFDYDFLATKYPDMPDPRKTTVPFTVGAVNYTAGISKSDTLRSLLAFVHYNTQIKCNYDSCRGEFRLSWHRYKGWESNSEPYSPLRTYHLMAIPDGGGIAAEVPGYSLTDRDTSCIVRNIEINKSYSYYIVARRNDGSEATSFNVTKKTDMPATPTYINAVSTRYNDAGKAEVRFQIDPASETNIYEFVGTSRPELTFAPVFKDTRVLYVYGKDTTLVDPEIREETYYYMLRAWYLCRVQHQYDVNIPIFLFYPKIVSIFHLFR